ncbi:MAG: protein kinase family protein [Actinomycetales bacterium]
MSAFETLLSDRYELRQRVSSSPGDGPANSYWRAHDTVLARDVGIRIMDPGPLAAAAAAAAREAAGALDARFLRVLDVVETPDAVFVVSEWAPGRSLETLLIGGTPVPAGVAVQIAAELTAALSSAAVQGLRHGALRPGSVVITDAGAVKILGLGVDAALLGRPASERADVVGIGRLLYACLTARWPLVHGPSVPSRLRPAPTSDGVIASPRQVRAGVPDVLDALAAGALGLPPRSAITTLSDLGYALSTAERSVGDARGPIGERRLALDEPPLAAVPRAPEAPGPSRWLAVVVAGLLLVVLALLAWQLATAAFDAPPPRSSGSGTGGGAASPTASPHPLSIAALHDFDPRSSGGNGSENPDLVRLADDGDPTTAWRTMSYRRRPDLGGLKPGVGLIVDLGSRRDVTAVAVTVLGSPTTVQLRAAPQAQQLAEVDRLSDFRSLAAATSHGARDALTLRPPGPLQTRFLLVWLTALPPDGASSYRGQVAEIRVTGR